MNNRRSPRRVFPRLGMKFILAAAIALFIAFAVFAVLYNGLTWWVLHGEEFHALWEKKGLEAIASFQRYVTRHQLTVNEAVRDVGWEKGYRSTYLYLVDDPDDPFWNSFGGGTATAIPVRCADGTIYAYAEPSSAHYDAIGLIFSLGIAVLCFFAALIPFVWHIIHRITHLSQEMEILTGGDLSYRIESPGSDELAELGRSIEDMRLSVLEQMSKENEAVLANSRLITSLSHDLRTPLTKLTGYLELLFYQKYASPADRDRYLSGAIEKAMQMKELSDEMFRHFHVEKPAEADVETEVISGSLLLSQLLSELCFDLNAAGFRAELPVISSEFRCRVPVIDLQRIFDNLFSNIKKYADPAEPVTLAVLCRSRETVITIGNRLLATPQAEGKGIGLPTVQALLERSGGRLEYARTNASFQVAVYLPASPPDPDSE